MEWLCVQQLPRMMEEEIGSLKKEWADIHTERQESMQAMHDLQQRADAWFEHEKLDTPEQRTTGLQIVTDLGAAIRRASEAMTREREYKKRLSRLVQESRSNLKAIEQGKKALGRCADEDRIY